MTRQTFIQGALILILAGMITRFLGFINRLVIARLMGEEGVGLYMMVLPTLFLMITLTQIGLPIAISKRIAEANAKNDKSEIKKIMIVSSFFILGTSIILTTLLIIASPIITNKFLTDSRTIFPLIAMVPIVPLIAFSSIIKGYFQGMHNMKPQSYALILEQIVRVVLVFIFLRLLLPLGIEYAAAGAMISLVIGELCSFLYLFYMFRKYNSLKGQGELLTNLLNSKKTMYRLFSIALPTTGSRLINSISSFIEPILVTQSLVIAGVATNLITKQYGELMGYVMPLLFLPTFITNSLSIVIVPSISETEAKGCRKKTHLRIQQAIRISLVSGALATIVLSLFPGPILTYMYGTDQASPFLSLMAPFFILLYIQTPLQASLQALDLAQAAMWNSLIGNIVKLSVVFLLASNPQFGMMGVAIGIVCGVILITLLHYATLKRAINFKLDIIDLMKFIILILITTVVGKNLYSYYIKTNTLLSFISSILLLFILYLCLLYVLKIISRKELEQIPILKHLLK